MRLHDDRLRQGVSAMPEPGGGSEPTYPDTINQSIMRKPIPWWVWVVSIGFFLIVGSFYGMLEKSEMDYQEKLANEPPQQKIARRVLGIIGREGAQPESIIEGGSAKVSYNIDPWAGLSDGTTKLCYLGHVQKLVPAIFQADQTVSDVVIEAGATFTTIRGTEEYETAFSCSFTRDAANSIKWENIDIKNIPLLADSFSQHPGIKAD
ncbi:MAG: hypothetical protein ACYDCO_13665 [Armatimonadota bacterium]